MTEDELQSIRLAVDSGLGLTHERAWTLLWALEEAREGLARFRRREEWRNDPLQTVGTPAFRVPDAASEL